MGNESVPMSFGYRIALLMFSFCPFKAILFVSWFFETLAKKLDFQAFQPLHVSDIETMGFPLLLPLLLRFCYPLSFSTFSFLAFTFTFDSSHKGVDR